MKKRQNGVYYTTLFNPFDCKPFKEWMGDNSLNNEKVLEPFAGSNSIIEMLQNINFASVFISYDINPTSPSVQRMDTIKNYPKEYTLCITNPPWLYKASAHRQGLYFPETEYDDLYKLCLSLSLKNNEYVAALIPASFMQSGLFMDRLEKVVFLNKPLFVDTENPVLLALFSSESTNDISLYTFNEYIGEYSQLQKYLPNKNEEKVMFNSENGELGFIAIDNHVEPSIRFCNGKKLDTYTINQTSRSITRIKIPCTEKLVNNCNDYIHEFRKNTYDMFLTTFKGLRKDGQYRRRMSYTLTKDIIGHVQKYL